MIRQASIPRSNWQALAKEYGFLFHTLYGQPYWDESAYYQFTLKQIECDLEQPTEELHQMCLDVVKRVVNDDQLLKRFCIPEPLWDGLLDSWRSHRPSLYSRLDFCYNGQKPAKLYENNADTPTSVYETAFWQWLWLDEKIQQGALSADTDQFNSLQEKLIERFSQIRKETNALILHFSCCKESEEDRGTVQYLEDCANEAGIVTKFIYVEDIGLSDQGQFTDLDDNVIQWMFKLYPWEFMFQDEFATSIASAHVDWIEPLWKSLLSNKALLAMLWQQFPNHPNLLPTFFTDDPSASQLSSYVKKPLLSREGSNIDIVNKGVTLAESGGPYGEEGYVLQAYEPLPKYGDHYALIGSWLVNDKAAGISVREDSSLITQDLSRYLPHVIQG